MRRINPWVGVPHGMGSISLSDSYDYSMHGLGVVDDTYVPGLTPRVVTDPSSIQDPIAYVASHTNYTTSQVERLAQEDPDKLRRLMYMIQGGATMAEVRRSQEEASAQQTWWGKAIWDIAGAAQDLTQQVMAAEYIKPGSRYVVAGPTQAEQNVAEKQRRQKAFWGKVIVGGALVALVLSR